VYFAFHFAKKTSIYCVGLFRALSTPARTTQSSQKTTASKLFLQQPTLTDVHFLSQQRLWLLQNTNRKPYAHGQRAFRFFFQRANTLVHVCIKAIVICLSTLTFDLKHRPGPDLDSVKMNQQAKFS